MHSGQVDLQETVLAPCILPCTDNRATLSSQGSARLQLWAVYQKGKEEMLKCT